jgi:hypothetical protein
VTYDVVKAVLNKIRNKSKCVFFLKCNKDNYSAQYYKFVEERLIDNIKYTHIKTLMKNGVT